ncbi:unnamed protein product, partial [Meganyctiphanes norvegica]
DLQEAFQKSWVNESFQNTEYDRAQLLPSQMSSNSQQTTYYQSQTLYPQTYPQTSPYPSLYPMVASTVLAPVSAPFLAQVQVSHQIPSPVHASITAPVPVPAPNPTMFTAPITNPAPAPIPVNAPVHAPITGPVPLTAPALAPVPVPSPIPVPAPIPFPDPPAAIPVPVPAPTRAPVHASSQIQKMSSVPSPTGIYEASETNTYSPFSERDRNKEKSKSSKKIGTVKPFMNTQFAPSTNNDSSDSKNSVYISKIPKEIGNEDMRAILQACGPLQSYTRGNKGISSSDCCIVTYVKVESIYCAYRLLHNHPLSVGKKNVGKLEFNIIMENTHTSQDKKVPRDDVKKASNEIEKILKNIISNRRELSIKKESSPEIIDLTEMDYSIIKESKNPSKENSEKEVKQVKASSRSSKRERSPMKKRDRSPLRKTPCSPRDRLHVMDTSLHGSYKTRLNPETSHSGKVQYSSFHSLYDIFTKLVSMCVQLGFSPAEDIFQQALNAGPSDNNIITFLKSDDNMLLLNTIMKKYRNCKLSASSIQGREQMEERETLLQYVIESLKSSPKSSRTKNSDYSTGKTTSRNVKAVLHSIRIGSNQYSLNYICGHLYDICDQLGNFGLSLRAILDKGKECKSDKKLWELISNPDTQILFDI